MADTRPNITDIKLLFARSGNLCAFPRCTSPIAQGDTLIGEVCHIKAARPEGPRFDPHQTPQERHGYGNLILLCPTHHTVIDDDVDAYTVERLLRMKSDHESRVSAAPEPQAERIAQQFVHQGTNIAGGVAASVIHAQNFNVHSPPVDTFMQTRRLQAIEKLWAILRGLNKEFSNLLFIHTLLTPAEMDDYFHNGWPEKYGIGEYALHETVLVKMHTAGCDEADKERPFVSPRLWGVFFILRAVYGRLAYLCQCSFEKQGFKDWRKDSGMDQLLRTTLPAHAIDSVKAAHVHGIHDMIDHLEIQFMNSAGMTPS
jgi:hypothetical protein